MNYKNTQKDSQINHENNAWDCWTNKYKLKNKQAGILKLKNYNDWRIL